MFCSVPTGTLCTRFMFCTPTGDMKILIYELLTMYIVIEDHCCSHIYYMFSHLVIRLARVFHRVGTEEDI